MQVQCKRLCGMVAVLAILAVVGCTHRQLARSTVLTASTVMDIQYRMILTNLAMISVYPDALPSHLEIDDGVIQVSDGLGFGHGGGFTSLPTFGLDRMGPNGRRQLSEQWGADATLDPQRLTDLQDLYRVALNLPPLPPANLVAFLRQQQESDSSADEEKGPPRIESRDSAPRQVPIDILISDVPPAGWYQLGAKRDIPPDACYVGCYGDRYAWVTPEGMPGLARFTLTVLAVVKLKPGEPGRRGLAFTR